MSSQTRGLVIEGVLVFIVGFLFGCRWTRLDISNAIRSGRLSLNQRVENFCREIETSSYISVGR